MNYAKYIPNALVIEEDAKLFFTSIGFTIFILSS